MYNPELARYMQADPIGVNGGMNIYSYVENNPLNATDRLGLAEGYINYGLTKNETDGWFYFMFKVEEYYKEFNPFINDKLRLLSHGSYQTLNQFTPEELANQIISGNFKTNYGIKNNKYYDEQIKSGKPIRLRLEACNTGANWMNATMTGDVQQKAYMDVLGNLLRSDLKNRGANNMLTIEAPNGLTSFNPLGDSVSPPTKLEWNGNIGKFIEKEY